MNRRDDFQGYVWAACIIIIAIVAILLALGIDIPGVGR